MIEGREPGLMSDPFRFEARVGGADPSPVLFAAAFVVFILLAIAKPWETPGPAIESGRPDDARALAVAAAPLNRSSPARSEGAAAVSELCAGSGTWRTAAVETWRGRTVRVWRAIDPGPASRPLDPAIPAVPAMGESIPAIGYCAPTSGPEQPLGASRVHAWWVDGDAVQALQLRQIAPVAVSSYGGVFGPPANLGSTSTWPNGRVVFRYEELATGTSMWFAIEVNRTKEDPSAPPQSSGTPTPQIGRSR